jgi:hypothetical protein
MMSIWRLLRVFGLAMLALMIGAMRFTPAPQPVQVSLPPAIETQVLQRSG